MDVIIADIWNIYNNLYNSPNNKHINKGDKVYIKYNKFIIKIEILNRYTEMPDHISFYFGENNYKDFERTNYKDKYSFKVLDIENIVTREHVKMKGRYIIGKKYKRREYIFINYEHAYFDNFIEKEQWKLFPNGFAGECKITNTSPSGIAESEEIFYMINGIKEGQYQRYAIQNKKRILLSEGNFINGKKMVHLEHTVS